jgi:hypothetical protein
MRDAGVAVRPVRVPTAEHQQLARGLGGRCRLGGFQGVPRLVTMPSEAQGALVGGPPERRLNPPGS